MKEELSRQLGASAVDRDRIQCLAIVPEGFEEHEAEIRGLERIWEKLSRPSCSHALGTIFATPPNLVIHDVSRAPLHPC